MPIFLGDTREMKREDWLAMREHGADGKVDVTIGGSDVGYILEDNDEIETVSPPFDKTSYKNGTHKGMLWQRKRCEYLRVPYTGKKPKGRAIDDGVFNEKYVFAR